MSWIVEGTELIGYDPTARVAIEMTAIEILRELRSGTAKMHLSEDQQVLFSPLPLNLKISVAEVEGQVRASLYGSNGFAEVPVRLNQVGAIIDEVWHPIQINSMKSVNDWYLRHKISPERNLSMHHILDIQNDAIHTDYHVSLNGLAARALITKSTNPNHHLAEGVQLYGYQVDGLKYLYAMQEAQLGCLLADEMGLGKTLQVIALLSATKGHSNSPSLVVTPVSLIENWKRELEKFAPDLKFKIRSGSHRSFEPLQFQGFDIVLSNYETVTNDHFMYKAIEWNFIILDEAQYIKNPTAKRTKAVKSLVKRIGIAVSGTPFENHTSDVWSLTDFVLPTYLGDIRDFEKNFPDTEDSATRLHGIIEPLVLRRKLAEVENDLPERIDGTYFFKPSPEILANQKALIDSTKFGSISLEVITKLRITAAHIANPQESEEELARSQKWQYLRDALEEIFESKQKALIFSSFNLQSEILDKFIKSLWPSAYVDQINGSVPALERLAKIEKLENSNYGALILNPQAAGIGLNITSANHVFHFNPEWNPALTEQSTKRAHRNGQRNRVVVHYLFYAGTVEEMIADSQAFKNILGGLLVPENSDLLSPVNVIEKLRNKF